MQTEINKMKLKSNLTPEELCVRFRQSIPIYQTDTAPSDFEGSIVTTHLELSFRANQTGKKPSVYMISGKIIKQTDGSIIHLYGVAYGKVKHSLLPVLPAFPALFILPSVYFEIPWLAALAIVPISFLFYSNLRAKKIHPALIDKLFEIFKGDLRQIYE